MAKKLKQLAEKSSSDSKLLQAVRESAQEIWQAGLGAFAKAQQEGTKMFEALVKEGEGLSKKTRSIAEGRINEVTGNVGKAASQFSSKAQAQATEAWDKLEQVLRSRGPCVESPWRADPARCASACQTGRGTHRQRAFAVGLQACGAAQGGGEKTCREEGGCQEAGCQARALITKVGRRVDGAGRRDAGRDRCFSQERRIPARISCFA